VCIYKKKSMCRGRNYYPHFRAFIGGLRTYPPRVMGITIYRWALISMWLVSWENKTPEMCHRGKATWEQCEKAAIFKPRREAWNRSFPQKPQKAPVLTMPWPWTSSSQNCEQIHLCFLSHTGCDILFEQSRKINTDRNPRSCIDLSQLAAATHPSLFCCSKDSGC
jgi:hypothetical protein